MGFACDPRTRDDGVIPTRLLESLDVTFDAQVGAIAARSQAMPSRSLESLDVMFDPKAGVLTARRHDRPSHSLKSRLVRLASFLIAAIAVLSITALAAFYFDN
jgi:hypothetical protein